MDIYHVPFLEDGLLLKCAHSLVLADALVALPHLYLFLDPCQHRHFLVLQSREDSGVFVQYGRAEHLNTSSWQGGLMTHGFQKEESTSVGCGNGELSWTSMLKEWVGIKRQQEPWVCGLNPLL